MPLRVSDRTVCMYICRLFRGLLHTEYSINTPYILYLLVGPYYPSAADGAKFRSFNRRN